MAGGHAGHNLVYEAAAGAALLTLFSVSSFPPFFLLPTQIRNEHVHLPDCPPARHPSLTASIGSRSLDRYLVFLMLCRAALFPGRARSIGVRPDGRRSKTAVVKSDSRRGSWTREFVGEGGEGGCAARRRGLDQCRVVHLNKDH